MRNKILTVKCSALISILLVSTLSNAQTCNPSVIHSAPDSRYELVVGSGGSEVLDKQTKLIWQRCSIGKGWNGKICVGTASTYTWAEALVQVKAVGNGYRLPNIKELESLVEEACYSSSINETFFPDTGIDTNYWSASPIASTPTSVWVLYFNGGNTYGFGKEQKGEKNYIRVVRSSQ